MVNDDRNGLQRIKIFFTVTLIISTLLSGFVSNFLSNYIPSAGALLTDTLCFLVIIFYILEKGLQGKIGKAEIIIFGLAVLFGLLIIVKSLTDNNLMIERILGIRNFFLYLLAGITLVSQKKQYLFLTIEYTYKMSIFLCVFAICQYLFRDILPQNLLSLPQDANAFFFNGTDIFRVNALIGNTIIFTGLAIWTSAMSVSRFIYKKSPVEFTNLVLSSMAVFLTYSRAAWVFIIFQTLFIYFMINKKSINGILRFLFIVLSMPLFLAFYYINNSDDFIIKRLLSTESTTVGSTQVHGKQLRDAWSVIEDNPIFGVGVGSQGTSAQNHDVIITDGWMPQVILELGFPIGILLLFFVLIVSYFAYKLHKTVIEWTLDSFSISFMSITLYYLSTGLINSAFVGKVTYLIYWICAGIILSAYVSLSNRRNSRDL